MVWQNYIPVDLQDLYEIYDYRHAAAILVNEFPDEFSEICEALRGLKFTKADIEKDGEGGGLLKNFSESLLKKDWNEKNLTLSLLIDSQQLGYDIYKMDHFKGRIAINLERKGKDQTFEQAINAFNIFFKFNRISVGILVTHSTALSQKFRELSLYSEYKASTIHVENFLSRMDSGRNGVCPVLVFGIHA